MSERAERAMTIEVFLLWQEQQEARYELVGGQPVAMTGARIRHDRVTSNALAEIKRQLRASGSPCDAFTADIGIRTPGGNIRRPDASVLCPPFDEDAMTSDRPRIVIEVLSEPTERVDRLVKLGEYEGIGALDYIVMIDPARIEVGFWLRNADRSWRAELVTDGKAELAMPSLGLSIGLASLYERVTIAPPPTPRLVWEDGGA